MRVFIWGLGYTGLGIANILLKNQYLHQECVVSGTCRTYEKAQNLRKLGIDAHIFDVDGENLDLAKEAKDALLSATHVLSTIPPLLDHSDPVMSFFHDEVSQANWKGYLSTTGVYGDHNGAWVNEDTPCLAPETSPAYPRLAAEQKWLDIGGQVFRLAGIYGPGRSALSTIQKEQEQKQEQGLLDNGSSGNENYVNRIHVGDITDCVVASMLLGFVDNNSNSNSSSSDKSSGIGRENDQSRSEKRQKGCIYNLSDDLPAPRGEVMAFARKLLADRSGSGSGSGISSIDANLVRVTRRAKEHKKVNNSKMKKALRLSPTVVPESESESVLVLRYPTYREGLQALVRGEQYPF